MENFIALVFDLLTLLTFSYKICLKNGRLMALIAALIISLQCLLYMLYLFNVFPVTSFTNLTTKLTEDDLLVAIPVSLKFTDIISLQKDLAEWIFLLIGAISSLLVATSTTYASAFIQGSKNIFIKDLVSMTFRSLKRPLLTNFYIALFVWGYQTFIIVTLLPLALFLVGDRIIYSKVTTILFAFPTTIFCTYLSVIWNLSLVIAILEEKYGFEALGKAAKIVKGIKLQGIILNLLLTIISLTLIKCLRVLHKVKQAQVEPTVISLVLLISLWLVRMFGYTVYTVLYNGCNKSHEDDVELQAADMDIEYHKLRTKPLIL